MIIKRPVTPILAEPGVPIPAYAATGGRKRKYPISTMAVGDSFPVSGAELSSVRALVSVEKRNNPGKDFYTAEHEGAWRCWRTK